MMFADTDYLSAFAKDPCVVNFNGEYYMYYTLKREKEFGIGIAKSSDLDHFVKVSEIAATMPYEEKGICAPGAIVLDGVIHLFYQTYGNGKDDCLCHATSRDGLNFQRNDTNPIFKPTGDWNCGRAIDADVVAFHDQLLMYFASRTPDYTTQIIGVCAAPINSKFNKEDFKQLSNEAILKPELLWEQKCIEASATCVHNNKIYMFYAGAYNNAPQQIGCAVSRDGVHFERLFDQPFLPCGKAGEWNSSESGHPFLFTDIDGSKTLFFQGNNDNGKTWYLSNVKIDFDANDIPYIVK